ncbi:MAG TPA: HD domain-containing phosphohydrolase [Bryobacteraceae bacterium]|nr:HD domain-containing phosphohydrolase [Bryobacteraceae bacterium]
MNTRILCVDDEPNVLAAFRRQLRTQFDIATAEGPERGLQELREDGPFAVVISDLRMPGMDGTRFLAAVKQMAPDTVRVMLTGQADLYAAVAAVNQGNIFRFLLKPCPREVLLKVLEAALEQHRLVLAERELLEQTLRGAIQLLTEILSLVNPAAFSRANRIRAYVAHMAAGLQLPDAWQYELAAMLSQIGCIAVPPDLLEKAAIGEALSSEEEEIVAAHPLVAQRLLENVPRLELVAKIVGGQARGGGIGSEVLRAANDFDRLIRGGSARADALEEMRCQQTPYDPSLLAALENAPVDNTGYDARVVTVSQLDTLMIIDQEVRAKNGVLLLTKGQAVTYTVLARLKSFARTLGVMEPFAVLAPPSVARQTCLPKPVH